ncbi:MAG: hypothetical protein EXQ59_01500 [Acidobacteria bacterium]|nr:hypothetical protein [Acidobacteriota bacterium]
MRVKARSFAPSLLLLAALASGCAHARASVGTEMPPLEMPLPPPHIVEAATPEATTEVTQIVGQPDALPGSVDELDRTEPIPQARPAQPRVAPPRPAAARADPPVDPPAPPDDPRTRAPLPLQSTPTQREAEVEAAIRADIRRASDNLNRVDYRLLNPNARDQYNSAKTLIQLADEALLGRNLVFAKSLAEKAGTLATQLAGR